MPPKTKRFKLLQESARRAREGLKRTREGDYTEAVGQERPPAPLLPPPTEAIVSDCSSDVSYDIRNEPPDSRLEEFVEEWVMSLSRDNVVSLGLFCAFS
jgi:hypothetical protein